jgi:hypothetical protein
MFMNLKDFTTEYLGGSPSTYFLVDVAAPTQTFSGDQIQNKNNSKVTFWQERTSTILHAAHVTHHGRRTLLERRGRTAVPRRGA